MGGASISSATAGAGAAVALSSETVTISIPAPVAAMLQREARARRKTAAAVIAEWLQEQAEEREAVKVLKRLKDGKEKTIPAAEVYKRMGL